MNGVIYRGRDPHIATPSPSLITASRNAKNSTSNMVAKRTEISESTREQINATGLSFDHVKLSKFFRL